MCHIVLCYVCVYNTLSVTFVLFISVTPTADITNLSMITFKAVAQQLPVALRQWFITLDRKAGNIVEEYVVTHIVLSFT